MKIELKNIKFSEALSEESNAFVADVYVNGVKAGYAKNNGIGGCTFYHPYEGKNDLLEQAEAYCKTLPPIKYSTLEIPMNLGNMVDELFEAWLIAKEKEKLVKKLKKDMLTGLCIKTPNGYTQINWSVGKRKFTIAELLNNPHGRNAIKTAIANAKAEGKKILNTNIPKELC